MQRKLNTPAAPASEQTAPEPQATGCLLRIYWMMLGNVLLVVFGYFITTAGAAFSTYDVLYWLGVAALLGARLVDIRLLHGQTSAGEPANMGHWKRYALLLLAAAFAGWLVAHTVGYFSPS